ncbi:SDR family NAD(P)-dependent oxidoreductase [Roseibium salinum]|uniref:SDR family NAD(P)-dependent oxidoreductase n=1 Tax=Roseibium salinum TaxID=1604349 RepID=A0ABT3R6U6_9HYPH|nr:SDR family NAD(P)-dependent oxidoreductase [Roseibium sp. DSM 29163]MCX2724861.1 SDR family NAD(P)-dependent oxidoreductase [Roseibium sp. DSM 29163]
MSDYPESFPAPRSILITGCSSGIGAAAAHMLRGRNWRVFSAARAQGDVDRLLDQGFEAFRLDYEDADSIKATADAVLELTDGRLDAVFNNGAYAIPGALEDIPTRAMRALFEANFIGWHDLTRQLIPAMRANGSGRIVQCSSVLGFVALKYRGAYTASKFALEAYSDTLRQELKGTGVHVSLIEPGPIATRFTENALANFDRWIGEDGLEASVYRDVYKKRRLRMEAGEPGPFKLLPDAVVKRLIHAVEAKRPRARYHVTVPTRVMAVAKRILPTGLLDRFCIWAADNEE